MKKITNIIGAALIFAAVAFTVKPFGVEPLAIGSPMPKAEHKMKDISGKEISMKEAVKEKGILVMFSCNTCPYVIKNQSRTNDVAAYALKRNFGVIVLNSNEGYRGGEDSFDEMRSYAKEQNYNWSYVVDYKHEVADAFGANRTPECFLFDNNLKLVYHGAIDDNPSDATGVNRHHLKEAINEVSAGKEVSVKESRSVGCTIKRLK